MQVQTLLSKDLAHRLPLTRPSEPTQKVLAEWSREGLYIGKTLHLHHPFFWNPAHLVNPHLAVVGITGSGKSFLVKTLITRASLMWDANALILDWTGEYRRWVEHADGRVIDLAQEKVNFLQREGELGQKLAQILQGFDILLGLDRYPKARVLIQECLEKTLKSKAPTMRALLREVEKRRKEDQTAYALLKRLYLQGENFFAKKTTFRMADLLKGLVCVDLHNLPTEEMRTLFGLMILQYVKEVMRAEKTQELQTPKLLLVLDEAWKLAKDERSDVIAIVREGRKYSFAAIIASQNPTDIHPAIFSNVGTVCVFKLLLSKYRQLMQKSLGYPEAVDEQIANFPVGRCLIRFSPKHTLPSKSTYVIIEKVVGEEFFTRYSVRVKNMEIEFDREKLVKALRILDLPEGKIQEIKAAFEHNEGELEGTQFLDLLESQGVGRAKVLLALRELGLSDEQIVHLMATARAKKARELGGEEVLLILE